MQNLKEIPHPGKVLNEEFLKPNSISIEHISKQTGISQEHFQTIINGKRAISNTTAKKLSKFFQNNSNYWMNLQRKYDSFIIQKKLKGIIPDNDALENVMIKNPHDKLIKLVFSDRIEAVEYFQKNLPAKLVKLIDWDTLELEGSKYIDEELKESESDLLYSVYFKNGQDKCFLYMLFEHQTKPDKWIKYRLLKYKVRIWDESFKRYKTQEKLIPILSMVIYIGSDRWTYSPEFSDLIHTTPLDSKYNLNFEHVLWDYSNQSIEFKGAVKAKIAYLLIQAHFYGELKEIFQTLADYFSQFSDSEGINYLKVFLIYIAATQEYNEIKELLQFMKTNHNYKGGKQIMTIIDEWKLEGELKGKLEGKLNLVKNMINAGGNWQTIYKLTGIDNKKFNEMKIKLKSFDSMPMIAQQALSKKSAYSKGISL